LYTSGNAVIKLTS